MLENFRNKLKEIYETEWEINIELSLEQIMFIVFTLILLWLILS